MYCLGKILLLVILAGAALLYYLSCTTEFSRAKSDSGILVQPRLIPRAVPIR